MAISRRDSYRDHIKTIADSKRSTDLLNLVQQSIEPLWSQLIEAVTLGNRDAAEYFVSRLIEEQHKTNLSTESLITKLKLYQTQPNIAYCLGLLYAGVKNEKQTLPILQNEPDDKRRAMQAIQFFEMAITLGHDAARTSLSNALVLGKHGCLARDETRCLQLNKLLADNGNQAAAYDYANLYRKRCIYPNLSFNKEILYYYLLATNGKNWTIAQYALLQIFHSFKTNKVLWLANELTPLKVLNNAAFRGNQFIALIMALSLCPADWLSALSDIKDLQSLIVKCNELPVKGSVDEYLSLALTGPNQRINNITLTLIQLHPELRASAYSLTY